jgi:hypothetical protein
MARTSDRLDDVATAAAVVSAVLVLCGAQPLSAAQFYLTGAPSSKSLSLTSESGASYTQAWSSGSQSWSNSAALNGDIGGIQYEFHIYAASFGSTSFQASILINAAVVAQASFSATTNTYLPKINLVTGIDPLLTGNTSLELRITHVGGSVGSILWGDLGGDTSFIRIPDPGDYNGDHTVDAADYVVWRKNDGTPAGYSTWRANFGQTTGTGSAVIGSDSANATVPEPANLVMLIVAAAGVSTRRRWCA